jgi:hypothetical protein
MYIKIKYENVKLNSDVLTYTGRDRVKIGGVLPDPLVDGAVPGTAVGEEGPVGAPHQQALTNVAGQIHHRP